ncbi:MAG: TonB-dependent siderophore receptor [Rhodocyclaceae bacterium]|nr:TonB-dependent siderophore receptor [Rhodocyclaceae bacterium]
MRKNNHPSAGNARPWRQRILARSIHGLLLGAAVTTILPATDVYAQAAATRQYAIPAGNLTDVLKRFGIESGLLLSFSTDLTAGRQSPGLNGTYTTAAALRELLKQTGLEAVPQGGGYLLRRAPTPVGGEAQLAPVTVTAVAQQESAWGPVKGYAAKRSATGTKTDTPILETPQSISIVGTEEIKTRAVQNLSEAFHYVSGVTTSEGFQNDNEMYIIRGFSAHSQVGSIYRDGTKFSANTYNAPQEPYGLERAEVLKGASSVLYGTAAPGGIINTVTKRPPAEPLREISVELGNFDRKQLAFDLGGPLDQEGVWSYRLTALKRDADSFRKHSTNNRDFVSSALKWQPSAQTSLTLLGEYVKDETTPTYGLPIAVTLTPGANGKVRRDLFTGEPGWDKNDQSRWSVGYLFEHEFSPQLKVRSTARHFEADANRPATFLGTLEADGRTMNRTANMSRDRTKAFVIDNSLQYDWQVGSVQNTSLVGIDYTRQEHEQGVYRGTLASLDLFNPIYGATPGSISASNINHFQKRQLGIYAQNQAKFNERWVVALSGRYDSADLKSGNRLTNRYSSAEDHAFTGRIGLVRLFENGFAPFISYGQSFEPITGMDRTGSKFDPTEGEQYEIGIRYQPPGSDFLLTASAYQLTQFNLTVRDPADQNFSVQEGEVRSRGFEFEARGKLTRHASLIAAYAYTDARTIKSSPLTPQNEGQRTNNVPYHNASLWADYDFGGVGVPGLQAGIGVRRIGQRRANALQAPSYTLVDAMVGYTTGPWRLALNVTNLTDKDYFASCTYGCFFGEPRKVIGTVTYRW